MTDSYSTGYGIPDLKTVGDQKFFCCQLFEKKILLFEFLRLYIAFSKVMYEYKSKV